MVVCLICHSQASSQRPIWQHVYRRVLRELNIEFEPTRHWTRQFLRRLQLSWKLAATCPWLCQCDRFRISQDRIGNLDKTAVRMVPTGERGWSKGESAQVFASRAFVTVTVAANMSVHRLSMRAGPIECDIRPHIKLCYVQRNFTGYTQPLDRAYMRAFKSSIRSEVAKHFAEFFLEAKSNFERANLDSSTSVLRQLLLSFVRIAALNADSPQHRAAGWRFSDWNEVEQRELLAEAKRFLETEELFPQGTAEEPHAPDAEAGAIDSEQRRT